MDNNIDFKFKRSFNFAFNLSEILITLGIIGVVAAITIPTLMNHFQNQECLTSLKKFYSDFNNALEKMSADYGCPNDLKCTGIFDEDKGGYRQNSVYVMKILSEYIKTDKICGDTGSDAPFSAGDSGCFGFDLANRPYRFLNGELATNSEIFELNTIDRAWATLQNGVFYGLLNHVSGTPSKCENGICSILYVDVNGVRKPNQMGRDFFRFYIMKNAKLTPATCNVGGSCSNTACDSTGYGQSCSTKILEDSWQMNY